MPTKSVVICRATRGMRLCALSFHFRSTGKWECQGKAGSDGGAAGRRDLIFTASSKKLLSPREEAAAGPQEEKGPRLIKRSRSPIVLSTRISTPRSLVFRQLPDTGGGGSSESWRRRKKRTPAPSEKERKNERR